MWEPSQERASHRMPMPARDQGKRGNWKHLIGGGGKVVGPPLIFFGEIKRVISESRQPIYLFTIPPDYFLGRRLVRMHTRAATSRKETCRNAIVGLPLIY